MQNLEYYQNKVEEIFKSLNFEGHPSELYDPVVYTMSLGGKRIRPSLLLMSCGLFNQNIEKAIKPAIAIEIFHNFTLVHDDIMDNAPIRRGKETVFKKWNTNIALLSGDTMFAKAYQYLEDLDSYIVIPVLKVFSKTAIEICEGQQLDMNFETQKNVQIVDYLNMIRLKTAVLLGACLKIGAIIGNSDENNQNNLYDFGVNIGMAFQLKDDLLDVFSDEKVFGKQTGGDIACNKKTFLLLKAFELAKGDILNQLNYNIFEEKDIKTKIIKVKEIYNSLDIEAETTSAMQLYYNKAISNIEQLTIDDNCKQLLIDFADKLMNRVH